MWVLLVFYLTNGTITDTYRFTGPGVPFKSRAECEEVLRDATADIERDKDIIYGKDFTMKCEKRGVAL